MLANRKVTGRASSMPVGIGIGVGASAVLTLVGSLLVAYLINSERMQETSVGYGAMVILLAASLVGALIAAALIKHRRLVVCISVGTAYMLLLLIVNVLCFGGQFAGVGVTALVILAGSGAAALIGLRGAGKGKRRKYRTG